VKLALIGDPVAHSCSPEIHKRLLREAGIEGSYETLRVKAGETAAAIRQLRANGFDGCNVTSPLKEEVLAACDIVTTTAQRVGAANTIALRERIVGTNTDGRGAATALRGIIGPLENRRIVVLGTGPTARAAVAQLVDDGACVDVWGRDEAKVSALCTSFGAERWKPQAGGVISAVFSALAPEAQLEGSVVDALRRAQHLMDANYGERATLAAQIGREISDGLAMLEAQAEASLDFWMEEASERTAEI
jgi:shikimate dehydrogenase